MKRNDVTKTLEKKGKAKEAYRKFVLKVQTVVATLMISGWTMMNKACRVFAEGDADTGTSDTPSSSGTYDGTGASAWNNVMNFIWEWVPKIGAVVCAIGLIEFALAFKSEDADGKTRGLRTAIAGAMVIGAVATVKGMTLA